MDCLLIADALDAETVTSFTQLLRVYHEEGLAAAIGFVLGWYVKKRRTDRVSSGGR